MDNTKVKLNGEVFVVNFPNVSEHMNIEAMKQTLTNGKYGEMVRAGVKTTNRNLDLVDAISTFSVLVPTLKDRFKGMNLLTIDLKTGLELSRAYKEEYYPWYDGIMTKLEAEYNGLTDEAKGTDTKG